MPNEYGEQATEAALTIRATVAEFVGWANSYGKAKQGSRFLPGELANAEPPRTGEELLHRVSSGTRSLGEIVFAVEVVDVDMLHIEATASNGQHPPSAELEGYFDALVAAIRQRWPVENAPRPQGEELLRPRLLDIAHLSAKGLTQEDIAQELIISPETVKSARAEIKQILNLPKGRIGPILQRLGYGQRD